jgi:hypothetical protein
MTSLIFHLKIPIKNHFLTMTDIEFEFLEVFYNRGVVPEQSFVNYLNGSLPESLENKKEIIHALFTKFNQFGFIHSIEPGAYQITDLGKEKFEDLNERKEIQRKLEDLKIKQFKMSSSNPKFWILLILVIVVISLITSVAINKWPGIISRIMHLAGH